MNDVTAARRVGPVLEGFVVSELSKQSAWSRIDYALSHFRSRDGAEVDVVCQGRDGQVVACEVKLKAAPAFQDARGLITLKEDLGERFRYGIVLYAGQDVMWLADRICAVPIPALWRHHEL